MFLNSTPAFHIHHLFSTQTKPAGDAALGLGGLLLHGLVKLVHRRVQLVASFFASSIELGDSFLFVLVGCGLRFVGFGACFRRL